MRCKHWEFNTFLSKYFWTYLCHSGLLSARHPGRKETLEMANKSECLKWVDAVLLVYCQLFVLDLWLILNKVLFAVTNSLLVCVYHLETQLSAIDWLLHILCLMWSGWIECQNGSDYYGSQGQSEYNISWATVVVASVHSAIVLASQVLTWSFNMTYALHQ